MSDDDTGGGLRGVRATPAEALFELLRERYAVDRAHRFVDLGGSSCLNLRVTIAGRPCVARVYRPYVSAPRLEAIQAVRGELAAGGVPCAEAVLTRDGQPWASLEGRLIEVERFVDSDAKMDGWERLEAGLPWLGRVHALLRQCRAHPDARRSVFANHVEAGEALQWTRRGTARIRGWGPTAGELRLAERAEELAHRLAAAEGEFDGVLPRQLVHGDFWDNNVLFRRGRVALITDFDFMGERPRIDDLALTLYFANASISDGADEERPERLRRLVEAYERGLEERLTAPERLGLPLALARQPLWAVGRWMALLDCEERARRLAAELPADVEWALRVVDGLERWRAAFA